MLMQFLNTIKQKLGFSNNSESTTSIALNEGVIEFNPTRKTTDTTVLTDAQKKAAVTVYKLYLQMRAENKPDRKKFVDLVQDLNSMCSVNKSASNWRRILQHELNESQEEVA